MAPPLQLRNSSNFPARITCSRSMSTRRRSAPQSRPSSSRRRRPEMPREKRIIAVAGNMGSGKSSLVRFLCQQFELQPFFEPNDRNPYLDDFYADMKGYAFRSQIFFLIHRFRIQKEMESSKQTVVQDRTIYEDA